MQATPVIDWYSFGLGFGAVFLLVQVTYLIYFFSKKFPEYFLMICYGMLTIDFLALMVWMFVFKPYAGDVKLFAGGMGLAIFTAMIHKIIKFMRGVDEKV
tara:strand:+ start:450 stop:749 length:300 start_codon:yes stop_codon:yes gene_type:complete